MKSLLLLSMVFLLIFSSSAFALPGEWWGNVTIVDTSGNVNITTNGALVSAMVNGQNTTAYDVIGTPDSNYYLIHVNGSPGDQVLFQVYGINASPTNATVQNWSVGDHARLNLLMFVAPTGGTCAGFPTQSGTNSLGCQEGYCVHNTCRAAATYCGDGFCDSGESCSADGCSSDDSGSSGSGGGGGGGGGGAPPAPAPAPTPPAPGEVLPVTIPVTDISIITLLSNGIIPSDLGITTIDVNDLAVTQTGVASISTTIDLTTESSIISGVLATSLGDAHDALVQLQNALSSGKQSPMKIQKKLEVFDIMSRTTGVSTTVSRVTLSFTPTSVGQTVTIVEVIPKAVAQTATEVHFIGLQPRILQADPIVSWTVTSSSTAEQSFSYVVDKALSAITSTTVSATSFPASNQACSPGAVICVSSELLGTCRSDGSGYDTSSCPYGCQNSACLGPSLPPAVVSPPTGGGIILAVAIIAMVLAVVHLHRVQKKKKKRHSVRYAFGKK